MEKPEEFAGGNPDSLYCAACADATGTLLPYHRVLAINADYLIQFQGVAPEAARSMARALLASMPAWRSDPQAQA
jgi:hypothetical protein